MIRFHHAIASLVLLITLAGCGSQSSQLTFRSNASRQRFLQKFDRAYYSKDQAGEYAIVLIDDGLHSAASQSKNGALEPSSNAMLSQVLVIRIRWQPLGGSAPDSPSATNAVLDWYVRGNDPAQADQLHYRGAGFVTLHDRKGQIRFHVRSAELEAAEVRGNLRDPLGASSVDGVFIANANDGQVDATLSAVGANPREDAAK